jgi:hypothetical protein
MLLVLASQWDTPARTLVARLQQSGTVAQLMLCSDLARRGWRVTGDPSTDRMVVGSSVLAPAQLAGVVTRLGGVAPGELGHVHADDRAYAAAEMQAFLLAWLSSLRCPLLNRPRAGSLAGVAWSAEQWVAFAARRGLSVRPITRRYSPLALAKPPASPAPTLASTVVAHVVGAQCFGVSEPKQIRAALELARHSEMDLLRVRFERAEPGADPVFVGAEPLVDVEAPAIAAAIAQRCAS